MPSLYNNIIRGKEISEKKLISPPIMENLYKEKIKSVVEEEEPSSVDIEKICRDIEEEAKAKGEEILNSYREKAEKIIEEANIEAISIKEEAKDSGYQEGYKKGYQEGYTYGIEEAKSEYDTLLDEANKAKENAMEYLENCYKESRKYINDVQEEIINIIIDVSKKVINKEITENKEVLLNLLEPAILKCADKEQIILKLSPKNASYIKSEKDRLIPLVDEKCNILILADGEIDDETFKVETPSGFVDASISSQINILVKKLLGENLQCTI